MLLLPVRSLRICEIHFKYPIKVLDDLHVLAYCFDVALVVLNVLNCNKIAFICVDLCQLRYSIVISRLVHPTAFIFYTFVKLSRHMFVFFFSAFHTSYAQRTCDTF